jgi:hypothetical protein
MISAVAALDDDGAVAGQGLIVKLLSLAVSEVFGGGF